jgi:hypothetical protein
MTEIHYGIFPLWFELPDDTTYESDVAVLEPYVITLEV